MAKARQQSSESFDHTEKQVATLSKCLEFPFNTQARFRVCVARERIKCQELTRYKRRTFWNKGG